MHEKREEKKSRRAEKNIVIEVLKSISSLFFSLNDAIDTFLARLGKKRGNPRVSRRKGKSDPI